MLNLQFCVIDIDHRKLDFRRLKEYFAIFESYGAKASTNETGSEKDMKLNDDKNSSKNTHTHINIHVHIYTDWPELSLLLNCLLTKPGKCCLSCHINFLVKQNCFKCSQS